jgi:hypothetical protein
MLLLMSDGTQLPSDGGSSTDPGESIILYAKVLLFQVKPRELDERVLARLYMASAQRWGDGRRYFDAIQREIEREQERKEKFLNQDAVDRAMPFWEHSRIRVGYGKSSGSKFSDYHS